MAEDEDPYDVLLVCRSATAVDIRKSYQELARKVCSSELTFFFKQDCGQAMYMHIWTGHLDVDKRDYSLA